MPRKVRQQFLVNGRLQGHIALRAAMYWLVCLWAVIAVSGVWTALYGRPSSWGEFVWSMGAAVAPMLAAGVLVLPMALVDSIRFSNRFVGPVYRLGRAMDRLADGQRVHNIEFRQGDFWFDFAQTFNRLNERVIRLEEQAKAGEKRDEEMPLAVR